MTTEYDIAGPGSAIMPICASIDFEELLDELELRLMRSSATPGAYPGGVRRGSRLAVSERACLSARTETKCFWHNHRLDKASPEVIGRFIDGLLARRPRYLAWALVPLFTELARRTLTDELVSRIVAWMTESEPVDEVVRDTVALTLIVEWFGNEPEDKTVHEVTSWCNSSLRGRARLGFVVLAAWLQRMVHVAPRTADIAYAACLGSAKRTEADIAMAIGWALRELLLKEGERLIPRFEQQLRYLTRYTFRTAVERLPAATRSRLIELWISDRRRRDEGLDWAQ